MKSWTVQYSVVFKGINSLEEWYSQSARATSHLWPTLKLLILLSFVVGGRGGNGSSGWGGDRGEGSLLLWRWQWWWYFYIFLSTSWVEIRWNSNEVCLCSNAAKKTWPMTNDRGNFWRKHGSSWWHFLPTLPIWRRVTSFYSRLKNFTERKAFWIVGGGPAAKATNSKSDIRRRAVEMLSNVIEKKCFVYRSQGKLHWRG